LTEAIAIAIQNNLTAQLALAQTDEARGQVRSSPAAGAAPRILGSVGQSRDV